MKKLFVLAVLVSLAFACKSGGSPATENTTPMGGDPAGGGGAMGGQGYGGAAYGGKSYGGAGYGGAGYARPR